MPRNIHENYTPPDIFNEPTVQENQESSIWSDIGSGLFDGLLEIIFSFLNF